MKVNDLKKQLDSLMEISSKYKISKLDCSTIIKTVRLIEKQQAGIEALKAKCKWYDDTFRLNTQTYDPKKHGAEE